jgi:fused signal recognition particle receptor
MEFVLIAIAIVVIGAVLIGFVGTRSRKPKQRWAAQEIASLREDVDISATTIAREPEVVEKPSFRNRLGKARENLAFSSLFNRTDIDDSVWDELEEKLIRGDVGVRTSMSLIDDLKGRVKSGEIKDGQTLRTALRDGLLSVLQGKNRTLRFVTGHPNVWLFVGVNGVGKTTTIGKLAKQQTGNGRTAIMAAGDTFRAAAGEQLETWAERANVEVVRGQEGGDPSAVIFDAVERAAARNLDLVLADTAGRLQNKTNLMNELAKVTKVASRDPAQLSEVLLVVDATTGQNGLSQAKEFLDVAGITGVVLTKLDGSAKGGIVIAIESEFGIPVKLVGLGETVDDLMAFIPEEYVDALLS